ncbi:Peptidase family M50 [Caloramator mitchellensis]|uniref:Peptidase family M50 n=1 Tax=Caloramator mitchellensis TaxID=908809 RepID=A0A0R3JTF2_CALMK|nr:site-2 protease family protein [Caloramator mitchellensis]KRQ86806.1 Peptidase family M50 [Caloramator mitchellensis]
MFSYNVATFILTAIAIIISLSVHEFSHALVSTAHGDETPSFYGRLTINPFAHIDLMGMISLFIFKFGWAKPVPINPNNYKNRRIGIILTSAAGPLSNLVLAFFSAAVYFAFEPTSESIVYFLRDLIVINSGLAVFNILPLPPLDGSKIFAEVFRGKAAEFIYSMEGKGTFILFLLLMFSPFQRFISTIINLTIGGIIALAIQLVSR